MTKPRDPTLDLLLDLDGQVLVVDSKGGHWVRFVVTQLRTTRAYAYRDAATLLADFWTMVDAVLRERGVIP